MQINLMDENGQPVDLSKESKAKAWVFVFPGKNLSLSGQNDNMDIVRKKVRASVEGVKKRAEYMGVSVDDVRFFGAYYDETKRQYILDYNNNGTLNDGVTKLADDIIEARICHYGKLHKLPQAAAEMSGVGFFGHCFGGMVVASLEQALYENLQKRGVSEESAAKVLTQAKSCLTNPMLRIDRMPAFFETFAFVNCSDVLLSEHPEYKGVRENLLKVSGFHEEQLFHYNMNSNLWQYPENPEMRYFQVKGAKSLRVLMASSLDVPPRENIDRHIRQVLEVSENQHLSPDAWTNYVQLQKRYAGGHELKCLISPMNLHESEKAQEIQQMYLERIGDKLQNIVLSQARFNERVRFLLTQRGNKSKNS